MKSVMLTATGETCSGKTRILHALFNLLVPQLDLNDLDNQLLLKDPSTGKEGLWIEDGLDIAEQLESLVRQRRDLIGGDLGQATTIAINYLNGRPGYTESRKVDIKDLLTLAGVDKVSELDTEADHAAFIRLVEQLSLATSPAPAAEPVQNDDPMADLVLAMDTCFKRTGKPLKAAIFADTLDAEQHGTPLKVFYVNGLKSKAESRPALVAQGPSGTYELDSFALQGALSAYQNDDSDFALQNAIETYFTVAMSRNLPLPMKVVPGGVEGYAPLAEVLREAYDQSARGKGKERHSNGKPFLMQPIMSIGRMVGPGYPLGQAMKKSQEAGSMFARGAIPAAKAELLGVIVYTAAAILLMQEQETRL